MLTRRELLSAKAAEERVECAIWLDKFIIDGQPKCWTKEELCRAAMRDLSVSRSSFNFAWVTTIERKKCPGWYEPLRSRFNRNQL
jgi:hypothetical protein